MDGLNIYQPNLSDTTDYQDFSGTPQATENGYPDETDAVLSRDNQSYTVKRTSFGTINYAQKQD